MKALQLETNESDCLIRNEQFTRISLQSQGQSFISKEYRGRVP